MATCGGNIWQIGGLSCAMAVSAISSERADTATTRILEGYLDAGSFCVTNNPFDHNRVIPETCPGLSETASTAVEYIISLSSSCVDNMGTYLESDSLEGHAAAHPRGSTTKWSLMRAAACASQGLCKPDPAAAAALVAAAAATNAAAAARRRLWSGGV